MAQFPAFPIWTDALIADTDHLDAAEFGLYLRLLIIMWRAPERRVPNDDDWLARRCRCNADAIRSIVSEFCQNDGNWITQKRLLKEWEYVTNLTKKRRDAANARWQKENARGFASGLHEPSNAPTPTPTPTPIESPYGDSSERAANGRVFNGREKRGERLSSDWQPSSEDRAYAEGLGLAVDDVAEYYRNYWIAKPGQSGIKVNWPATWRNWCKREAERGGGARGHDAGRDRPGASSFAAAARAVLAKGES